MRKYLVVLILFWFGSFGFFWFGLSRREAALEPGIVNRVSVLHHRLARMMSLPYSRSVAHHGSTWGIHGLRASGWGASLWTAIGGALLFVWIRSGRVGRNVDEANPDIQSEPPDAKLTRRQVLRGGLAAIPVVSGGFASFAILVEPSRLRFEEYTVSIKDLPQSLNGLRIAHLSDLHLGDYIGLDHIRRAIAMANEWNPAIALLTGDYVQGMQEAFEPLARTIVTDLKTQHGYAGTLGNHDHWHGTKFARKVFADHSIPLIDNSRMFYSATGFSDTPAPDSICIGGVGDLWEDDVDFVRALKDAPEAMPRLVLSHNPDVAEMFAELKVVKNDLAGKPSRLDLMLSGHTHGGQVRLPIMGTPITPSRYGSKYAGGLVQGPDWPVLISRGIGMALMPVRFCVRPEVVLLTLVRETNSGVGKSA